MKQSWYSTKACKWVSFVFSLRVVDTDQQIQEVNIQNMNVELVAQMFKNYQSNVLFHLEGMCPYA